MEGNINEKITKAMLVNKENLINIKWVIKQIKNAINNNEKIIKHANEIDKKNNNGFILDFNIINNIFNNIEKEKIIYKNVTLSQKDNEKKIIYGRQIMDIGNVVVINDGNPYIIVEMILRNILAGNIFVNNGFMYGTNNLLVQIVQSILEQCNISKYLIQIHITENYDEILSNYSNIDLVICIADHSLQTLILQKSKVKTIVSGYENFDLYIEDATHLDLIDKIINTKLNIQIYINNNIKLNYDNAIYVDDIDEAIAKINYNGNKYSCAIFTTSSKNASKFIKEVKSKIVTVNTSPTIERIIDIKQSDLVNEKTIIYPLTFKFSKNNK